MNKVLRPFLLCALFLSYFVNESNAQQDPQYSHYMFNRLVYNPGVAGSEPNAVDITVLFRNQWLGFTEGTPVTQNIMAHMPLGKNFGGGIHVVNDMIGVERATNISLSFSYRIQQSWGNLNFGINGGIAQRQVDGTKLISPDGNYRSGVDHQDDLIPGTIESGLQPDFAFGAYYNYKGFFAGASVNHLLEPVVSYSTQTGTVDIPQVRHFYVLTGYKKDITPYWAIQPSLLYKTELTKAQLDLNAMVIYNQTIWAGVGFRGINNGDNRDAAVAMVGLQVAKNLNVGYSFDITVSQVAAYSAGTHEFMLNYKIISAAPPRTPNIIHCPRFL